MKYFEVISVGEWFRITVVGYLVGMVIALPVLVIFEKLLNTLVLLSIPILIWGGILGY